MAVRDLLHRSKLKEFELWMETKGYIAVTPKGEYEILRMIKPGEKPVIIFDGKSTEHVSFEERIFPLVAAFIKETR